MANLSLSTQIPQIGDSSQQLLARIAAAAADQNQQLANVQFLPSAARTTTQVLYNLLVPQGVIGIAFRLNVTAVPGGVDTLQISIQDASSFALLAYGSSSGSVITHLLLCKTGSCLNYPPFPPNIVLNSGLSERINLVVTHSGASSFTYSANYTFLK